MSVDVYRIDIEDRIVLSENLQGAQVSAILLANGITNASVARFFTNAAATRSEGVEATARWTRELPGATTLTATASYGSFDNDVRSLATNPVLPQIPLLGPGSIVLITDAQPSNKALLDVQLDWRRAHLNVTATQFGSITTPPSNVRQDGPTAIDVVVGLRPTQTIDLTMGVLNATDEYPPRIPDNTGRPYSEASPLGFNGREYFLKFAVEY